MPPKRRATTKSSADGEKPAFKRAKPTAEADVGKMGRDEEGNPYWEIGGQLRRVAISEFKGKQLISIREHYEKDGKVLPGKKGISMSVEQFNAFLSILPQLEKHLSNKGATIDRPDYDSTFSTSAKEEVNEDEEEGEEEEEVVNDEEFDDDDEEFSEEEEEKPVKKGRGRK